MGGREAMRGFMIQTLVVVLDALHDANSAWTAVTIEPDSDNDKVDILWELPGRKRAQQVKSSQNQISKAMAEGWAADLKASRAADEYELVLAGPIAQTVISDSPFSGVSIPMPLAIDTLALLERAITKLDRYLSERSMPTVPLEVRETLVALVAGKIGEGAVTGQRLSREEFDGWLLRWITAAYPVAIKHRLSANCELLWSEIRLEAQTAAAERAFRLVLPLSVINGGPTIAVVEWFLLKVSAPGREMRYEPAIMSENGDGTARRAFGDFAILPNAVRELQIEFNPSKRDGYASDLWPLAVYRFSLYVKYASSPEPRLVREVSATITEDHRAALSGTLRSISFHAIDLF